VEESFSARHPIRVNPRRVLAVALAGAVVAAVAVVLGGEPGGADRTAERRSGATGRPPGFELLARHPLSTRAAERRLQSLYDDPRAAVSCGALQPKPAHAIRRCEVTQPGGIERTVIVLSNPRGHELVMER
jgi:hypothetical protein